MINSIILTGGENLKRVKSAKTYLMDVQTGKWQQKSLPSLNVARARHSSVSVQDQTFVACGRGDNSKTLSSVEMLRLGAEAWELIDIPNLTPRTKSILSQIDQNHICILGGVAREG